MESKVLIIDDEVELLELLRLMVSNKKVQVFTARDSEQALQIFHSEKPTIVFCDYLMPKMDGIELMERFLAIDPEVDVVIFTGVGSVDSAVKAIKMGAYDYVTKPMDIGKISMIIDRIIESQNLKHEKQILQEKLTQIYGFDNFVGRSEKMQSVFHQIKQVAGSDSTILITGESGTGKELVANAIHYSSQRKGKPFVKVNCAALSESLIESELFGHEKGAFTSAVARRLGRFETANGGTLFLDEIGDIPPSTQIKLLRVLELKEFERLGSSLTTQVDVRMITATNKDLARLVQEGRFREDLYFRLNVIHINLSPLRERKEDIPLLAKFFLDKYSAQMNKVITSLSKNAMQLMENYAWPGNIRELENAIERGVVFCRNKVLTEWDLPPQINENSGGARLSLNLNSYSLEEAEKTLISRVLQMTQWNLKSAASTLGISRGTLYSKIDKHKLARP
ncbi:MAG: sigma-54-dependent Fis family transcriptional regulator [Calditrichaeota bacterium]|nr:MAG: sigma-54-dependent Fis family transcriptional regulator [Calditrichota bacterium]